MHHLTKEKAAEMWSSFDENEKAGVRFGMFPFEKMQAAEQQGYDSTDLAVALMECAEAARGIRA